MFYNDIVAKTIARYKKMKGVDPKELAALGADLKKGWAHVKRELKSSAKKVTKKEPKKAAPVKKKIK